MKCPNCWSPKLKAGEVGFVHKFLAACLLMVPLKCRHCFHRFHSPLLTYLWKGIEQKPARNSRSQESDSPQIPPFPKLADQGVNSSAKRDLPRVRRAA